MIHAPGSDFVDRIFAQSNRNPQVLKSLQQLYGHGRLANTGYLSILPVDQGIEHSAGASFAPNPMYFDSENIIKLAIEGGCNAVASTYGVLAMHARKYAHKIPFIVKINHNEFLSYPNKFDQIMFGSVEDAWNLGATAVGATIYFGSPESGRQIVEVAKAFERAHELGMATILWCYLRNNSFKVDGVDYHASADLSAQANHRCLLLQRWPRHLVCVLETEKTTSVGGEILPKRGKTTAFHLPDGTIVLLDHHPSVVLFRQPDFVAHPRDDTQINPRVDRIPSKRQAASNEKIYNPVPRI